MFLKKTCFQTEVACKKKRSFLKEAEPTCAFGSRGNNSCPMAQGLNIEEVLEALNVAGPADPANAGDGHADHVAQPGGRGRRRGGNRGRGRGRRGRGRGLVLVTHRVVEEDGGWPRRWRTREQSSKLLRTADLVEQGRVIVGFWSLIL